MTVSQKGTAMHDVAPTTYLPSGTNDPIVVNRRAGLHHLVTLTLAPLALLSACSTTPGGPTTAPWPHSVPRPGSTGSAAVPGSGTAPAGDAGSTSPGAGAQSIPSVLVEKRWFEEWFGNTPVVISQPSETMLQLSVPMVHSFDPGRIVPRPALAAVLDRVAESLRRQANARLSVVAAPDPGSSTSQGINRGHRIVEHIVSRRVMPDRINPPSAGAAGRPVLLQLRFLPPPIM
jgi:hypothetical protein